MKNIVRDSEITPVEFDDALCGDLLELVLMNADQVDVYDIAERIVSLVEQPNISISQSNLNNNIYNTREDHTEDNSILAGYKDCMDEAIRFLTEEENMAPEHPLVISLKTHLEQSRDRILQSADQNNGNNFYNCVSRSLENYYNQIDSRTRNYYNEIWSTG